MFRPKLYITLQIIFALFLTCGTLSANIAPTMPGNLSGTAISQSSVNLSWDASTDDRRVRYYRVLLNGRVIGTTRKLNYQVNGLTSATAYTFEVDASDGSAFSFVASVTVSTTGAEEPPEEPTEPVEPSPLNCNGKNKKLPACQNPASEEPPTEEPPTEEPPAEEPPTEEPPAEEPPAEEPPISGGVPAGWNVVFEDNFEGTGDIDTTSAARNWRFETLQDPLHRAGNSGMDELGNTDVPNWQSPEGKRWSAWYNQYNEDNAYRTNGMLVMQGLSSGETDPTRPDLYLDNGITTAYGDSKLYTAWLDTWGRTYSVPLNRHITDPESPNKTFRYGYFEARVNFSEMITPGFRLSMWLMPAYADSAGEQLVESMAYDSNGDNGVEIDIFEYEWISVNDQNRIQLSVHGGAAGNSSTNFDTESIQEQLHQGWHTIGLLWEADKLVWSLNGRVLKTVTDTQLIPDVYSYLILSREMNSGVKRPGVDSIEVGDVEEVLPYRPRDPGMYAQNVWQYRDRLATDRALIDYVRVWQP